MVWHCVRRCGSGCHCTVRFDVRADNSAARATVGSGRIRSLEVKTLWCQSVFQSGEITVSKCKGAMESSRLRH